MNEQHSRPLVGLIPAGGKATRLGPLPCSKEIFPLGLRRLTDGTKRPKVLSHYLLDKYRLAGAEKTYFILGQGKWDIPAYYGSGGLVGMDLGYLMMDQPYGAPYTLDQAFPFLGEQTVLLGFPDILFQPEDAFVQLLAHMDETQADLVMGLFPLSDPVQIRKSDMVAWTPDTGAIQRIDIKPAQSELSHTWVLACWSPTFSRFMHEFLAKDLQARQKSSEDMPEIYVGHVIQAAVHAGLNVRGLAFPNFAFRDVGTPESLEAVAPGTDLWHSLIGMPAQE